LIGLKGATMQKISDFAEERNVDRNAVTQYIRRHEELFKGHTKIEGNSMFADDEAMQLLDKKYPLPKPIEIIEDKESRQELIKTQRLVIQLQESLKEAQGLIAKAEATQMLLEDKEIQLEKAEQRLDKAEEEKRRLESKIEELQESLVQGKEKLAQEQSKTWIQKLLKG